MKNSKSKPSAKKVAAPTTEQGYVTLYESLFAPKPGAVKPGMQGEFRIADQFDYGLRTTTDSGTGRYLNEAI